jgi:hypothetical protein
VSSTDRGRASSGLSNFVANSAFQQALYRVQIRYQCMKNRSAKEDEFIFSEDSKYSQFESSLKTAKAGFGTIRDENGLQKPDAIHPNFTPKAELCLLFCLLEGFQFVFVFKRIHSMACVLSLGTINLQK